MIPNYGFESNFISKNPYFEYGISVKELPSGAYSKVDGIEMVDLLDSRFIPLRRGTHFLSRKTCSQII